MALASWRQQMFYLPVFALCIRYDVVYCSSPRKLVSPVSIRIIILYLLAY